MFGIFWKLKEQATTFFCEWKTKAFPEGMRTLFLYQNLTRPQSSLENFEFRRHFWKHCNAALWRALARRAAKKMLKQRLDFPFENNIETMDRLAKMHSQKIVETTVRFCIWKQDWNYG